MKNKVFKTIYILVFYMRTQRITEAVLNKLVNE